jgi:hypothetical protein
MRHPASADPQLSSFKTCSAVISSSQTSAAAMRRTKFITGTGFLVASRSTSPEEFRSHRIIGEPRVVVRPPGGPRAYVSEYRLLRTRVLSAPNL